MARLVICMPPYTRITAENTNATISAKTENPFFIACGMRSTTTGIFIWPLSLVIRLAPSRDIQANK